MPPEIVVDNDIVPRSVGPKKYPHVDVWYPTWRGIARIPSILWTGETAIHRPQLLKTFPILSRSPLLRTIRRAVRR